jgi:flagellar biosynthesis/type III secretory pathway protein FliH
MSSLLRSEAVAIIDSRDFGTAPGAPRIFGARVLRGDRVGMDRPISLSVPVPQLRVLSDDELVEEEVAEPAPPPPDFAELEEAARVQGYQIGFDEGYQAGMAAAEVAMAPMLQRMSALLNGIHENNTTFYRAAERQVVDLAIQIAQKVVEREIENMPDLAVSVIRAALDEMDARTAIRVRVNPDDAELLQRRWTQVVPPGIGADRIELQPDERIQTGGGIIETTHGQVDAQLSTKLEQLGNALWTFVMEAESSSSAVEDPNA